MPTKSAAQERLMQGVAHNPAFAQKVGIPQSVGKEFVEEDSTDPTGEWLEKVMLAEMIKPDGNIPDEPTVLSTPNLEPKKDADPCWEGYEQFGTKEKDGKSVPNCVPDSNVAADPILVIAGKSEKEEEEEADGGNREGSHFVLDAAAPIAPQAGAAGRAAGIMFLTPDGETLLMRRGMGGDYPLTFGLPGGHQEEGETLEEAARREALEETGLKYEGALELLHDDGQFATYIAREVPKFDVKMCDESTGFVWTHPEAAPEPIHPGLKVAFRIAGAKTEFDVAELMRENILSSPQPYANMSLLAIRITGTGLAYRSSIGEHVWRDPSLYLNEEFLKRCNGLTVIMDHPETAVLNTEEFKDRAIGSVMLPYIQGDEVWGIAKIYDQDAMSEIIAEGISPEGISTSPSVVFDNAAGNTTLTTENGEPLLIEGVPFLLDHIAIVTKARGSKGVWDKGGDAAGVLLTNPEVSDMTEKMNEPKADAQGDKLDAILQAIGSLATRVDSMEKNMPAETLVKAVDEDVKKADEAKADEEEAKDDAEGSNPVVHGKAGEIKPDEAKADGEEEEAKMDEKSAKADEEEAKYADAQAKCDSVMAAFGKAAARPLQGEGLMAYRKRLLRGLQAYSDAFKDVNLGSIKDAALLSVAEKQIFADALAAAKSPLMFAPDQLIEINEQDRAGRTITKFKGAMSAWLDDFKVPAMRATQFHTSNNQR